MAAWFHANRWNDAFYRSYRKFVQLSGESYMGRSEDCADLSMSMMIEFASQNALPLTFTDNDGVRYISKGTKQTPDAQGCNLGKSWGSSKSSYIDAVQKRIGAQSLTLMNMERNPDGPEAGDLLLKESHAGLIFRVCPPQTIHPLWNRFEENNPIDNGAKIPLFPGDTIAGKQGNQLMYYRDPLSDPKLIGPVAPKVHIDYLNHRGSQKPSAELIYWADPTVDDLKDLGFYRYSPKVLDNWPDWDGTGRPPR